MKLLARLRRERGTAVVMVSHDLNLASMYADRLLLLKDGVAAGTGAPAEVLTAPLLQSVYGCPLLVDENPRTGTPRIMPAPPQP